MTADKKTWSATVETDPDDPSELFLVFPSEFLKSMNWKAGDTLIWDQDQDSQITLTKNQEPKEIKDV
jgi:hypothetical protein